MLDRIRRHLVFELAFTVGVALILAFAVQSYAVKPYRVPSSSMEPTLHVGDRILANRLFERLGIAPRVGQVVVFNPPATVDRDSTCARDDEGPGAARPCSVAGRDRSSQTFVKRVVGVGGDRLAIRDGHVYRNGRREADAFAAPCGGGSECTFGHSIVVPHGQIYLMGDNRGDSDDSRYWGPVPERWVIGRVVARYWPPGRIDAL